MNYDFENEKELTLAILNTLLKNLEDYILDDKTLDKLDIKMIEILLTEYRDILVNDKNN